MCTMDGIGTSHFIPKREVEGCSNRCPALADRKQGLGPVASAIVPCALAKPLLCPGLFLLE